MWAVAKRTLERVCAVSCAPPQGEVRYDPTGKMPGRGAYLCEDSSCILGAKKKKALSRALRTEVDPGLYDELLQRIAPRESPSESSCD